MRISFPEWINPLSLEEAVKLLLLGLFGTTSPSGTTTGITVTPPTAGGVKVVGVVEVFPTPTAQTDATTNIPAGALSITVIPLSGFIGTINGVAWLDAATADAPGGTFSYTAQPGNALPAVTVTRSAGKYIILKSLPA